MVLAIQVRGLGYPLLFFLGAKAQAMAPWVATTVKKKLFSPQVPAGPFARSIKIALNACGRGVPKVKIFAHLGIF